MTKRIDGKARADRLVADVAAATVKLKSQAGIAPGLCAVLVGEDPASQVYVRNKGKAAIATGLSALDPAVRATKHAAKTWPDDGDVPLILRGSVGPTMMRSDRASCHEGDHPASLRCSIFGSKRARKISASSGSSKQ